MAANKAKLEQAFHEVDTDHNGHIDGHELEKVLFAYYQAVGQQPNAAKIKTEAAAFMKEVDKNNDHKISLQEFTNYFMQFCK